MMTKAGNILIVALRNMWFWAALVMLTLTSCRDNNNTPDMSPDINRVTLYPAIARSLNVEVITRANINVEETTWNASLNRYETSSEVYPDFDVNGTNISVFPVPTSNNDGVQKDENRTPGSFRYSSNKWHSSVSATDGLDYDLYAFSPANMPGATNQRFYPGAYSELLGWNTLDSEDPRRTTTFNADNDHILSNVNVIVKLGSTFDGTGIDSVSLLELKLYNVQNTGSYAQTSWDANNCAEGAWSNQSGNMNLPTVAVNKLSKTNPDTVYKDYLMMPL